MLQSVNSDYLAIHRMSHRRLQHKFKQKIVLGDIDKFNKQERALDQIFEGSEYSEDNAKEFYRKLKERKKGMSAFVKLYLLLRRTFVNPL